MLTHGSMRMQKWKGISAFGIFLHQESRLKYQLNPFLSICKLCGNSIMIIKMEGKKFWISNFSENRAKKIALNVTSNSKLYLWRILFSRWHSESHFQMTICLVEDAKKISKTFSHFSVTFPAFTGAAGPPVTAFTFSSSQVLQHKNYLSIVEMSSSSCFYCASQDSISKCEDCHLVSFCPHHRSDHRPSSKAKTACRPFKVGTGKKSR